MIPFRSYHFTQQHCSILQMSPTISRKTVRVRGLPPGVTIDRLKDVAKNSAKKKHKTFFSSARTPSQEGQSSTDGPLYSLAAQDDHLTSTITCSSVVEKDKVLQSMKSVAKWESDSDFIGLTVLQCCGNVDLE